MPAFALGTCVVPALAASPEPAKAASSRSAVDVELGLKAFHGAGVGYGTLGAAIDVLVFPLPHYGFGVSLGAFYVGNGADPHYSSSGTLDRGLRVLAFAEFDLFDYPVTPYARLGLGLGPTQRWNGRGDPEDHLDFMAEATLGAAARLGPLVLRAFATPSLFGEDLIVQYDLGRPFRGGQPVKAQTFSSTSVGSSRCRSLVSLVSTLARSRRATSTTEASTTSDVPTRPHSVPAASASVRSRGGTSVVGPFSSALSGTCRDASRKT